MTFDKRYYINTEGDGRLADTNESDVDGLFKALLSSDRDQLVVHFHGGLVNKQGGLDTAERLMAEYLKFSHPVFFVWEAGALENPRNNIHEILPNLQKVADEDIFKKLASTVTKWAVGKLQTDEGLKAADPAFVDLPPDDLHAIEMARAEADGVPYDEFEPVGPVKQTNAAERAALEQELLEDPEFVADVEAVVLGQDVEGRDELKAVRPNVRPASTMMDDQTLNELRQEAAEEGEKGLSLSATIWLARKAGKVFARVVKRFAKGRDHGVYVTVVEEILRELYLANVGGLSWHLMKKDTADTFVRTPGEVRGGELFLRKLGELGDKRPSRIVLIGHSTGAVFINNLLKAADAARKDPQHPLPEDFTISGVILMAPACSCADFAEVAHLYDEGGLVENFRMFTMRDQAEKDDTLVKVVYPRSLLYFVSGVVEKEPDGTSAFDLPLLGLDRFYNRDKRANDKLGKLPGVREVRAFVLDHDRAAWSKTDAPGVDGRRSNSTSHSGFDDTINKKRKPLPRETVDSILHILEKGWD